ncbi:DMT family transporter [Streptomyces sp. AK02-01A]|uniref:DMT family transporter n=1 Tax=Streptomyces sp. AK02-01A TaxID=3028648 RepID=UPI0029A96D67|nr:DMT family transporter [Streptomyces sp. AK02-01A]MDX3852367.1 DMT family transporter [Streptomyces sp. AK02-01A]
MTVLEAEVRADTRSSSRPLAISLAVVIGLLIPVQARINGELSTRLDDGIAAAALSFTGGLLIMSVAAVFAPGLRRGLRELVTATRSGRLPRRYLAAGILGSSLALAQSTTALIVGVAVFTVAAIAGQTLSGLIVDSIGYGGGVRRRPGWQRLAGAGLILIAAVVAALPQLTGASSLLGVVLPALAPLVAGFLLGFQQAMNGVSGAVTGSPLAATWANFFVGALFLSAVWAVKALFTSAPGAMPADWWVYLGGICGVLFIGASAVLVRKIGVLLLGMGSIAGQLVGSTLLDLVLPSAGSGLSLLTVVGAGLTLIAVATASLQRS